MMKNQSVVVSLSEQRRFNFIALRNKGGFDLGEYWGVVGDTASPVGRSRAKATSGLTVEHRLLVSDYRYARGRLLEELSHAGNRGAPYRYDLFALDLFIGDETYIVLAFPFVELARDVVDRLLDRPGMLKKLDILKVDLTKLTDNCRARPVVGQLRAQIVGIQVTLLEDPAISSIRLGGDQPLESSIYRDYLQPPMRERKSILGECIMSCELEDPYGSEGVLRERRARRCRMHMDPFGNFWFYLHANAENLVVLPHLMNQLIAFECLGTTWVNPLKRLAVLEE